MRGSMVFKECNHRRKLSLNVLV